MMTKEMVPITIICVSCRAEQEIRIPRERGIASGRYSWECFACQEKRFGVLGSGLQEDRKVERASRGGNGQTENGQEEG